MRAFGEQAKSGAAAETVQLESDESFSAGR